MKIHHFDGDLPGKMGIFLGYVSFREGSVVDKVNFVLLFSVRDEVLAELDFPFVVRVSVINEPLVFLWNQIGGVMIMGDRGTGKTTTIRGAGG